MSFFYGDLTVRGRDGRRVAIKDCRLEPLNLLIPGNAPIVVPKKHAWRSPSQQTIIANNSNKVNMEVAQDDYEADSEEEMEGKGKGEGFDDETQPLVNKSQPKTKAKSKCRKDSILKEKSKEAKHHRKAERHQKKAEREREEAASERERLEKRIAKQEAYIMKLKARYEGAGEEGGGGGITGSKKFSSKKNKASSGSKKATDSNDGATTDGSAAVREMLANMKIRAGGKENPQFFVQPGDQPWNVSDDSRLLALKKDGDNSYAIIGECMGRRTGEVKRRYKYLKECDLKIPGGDETIEAVKTGNDSTDVEKTAEETTDVEQTGGETTDAENKDGGGDTTDAEKPDETRKTSEAEWTEEIDTQLWRLKQDNKSWAEVLAIMGGSKSGLRDRYKHLKNIDFKVPNETADAEKPAEETFHAAKPDDPTTADAADPAWGGDFMAMASAFVEKQTQEATKSSSSPSSSSSRNKSTKPSPTPSPASFPGGTNAYIAQYSRNLLAEANTGRTRIPAPDEIFDEDDCILLALADSRRRENRWLEIQADYFNVTGRMVPQEVLRWKLGGVERPEDRGGEDD